MQTDKRRVLDLSRLLAWREDDDPSSPGVSRTIPPGTVLIMLPRDQHGDPRFRIEGEGETVWVSGPSELDKETERIAE